MSKIQLAIHISKTSLHLAEVEQEGKNIIRQFSFELPESTPDAYKSKLSELLKQIDLQQDYTDYTLAWATQKNAVIPLNVFNSSSHKDIHNLLFGDKSDEQTIDFNRLMELNFVVVYDMPEWVKSVFVRQFPRLIFKHEMAITLRALFQSNTYNRKISVMFNDAYITICIIYKSELIFFNSFEYQEVEDVLYHLLFVMEQEKLKDEGGKIHFLYIDEKTKIKAEKTRELIEKLKPLEKLTVNSIYSALTLHPLCV